MDKPMKILKLISSFCYVLFVIGYSYISINTILFNSVTIDRSGLSHNLIHRISPISIKIGLIIISLIVFAVVNLYFVFKQCITKNEIILLLVWLIINSFLLILIPPQTFAVATYMLFYKVLPIKLNSLLVTLIMIVSLIITIFLIFSFIYDLWRKRDKND